MREMIMMVVVLTILSSVSGGLLAYLNQSTAAQIEKQELEFVKGPAIRNILEDASNDPIADRFTIEDNTFFVGVYGGDPKAVVFETTGKGYGDVFGLMVGINTETDKIHGIGVTTHKETPGLGANAKDDPSFAAQFEGKPVDEPVKVSQDGGGINAISGATITSRGVCDAVTKASQEYVRLKSEITQKMQNISQ